MIDHHGLTEVGPVSFECWEGPGFLHLNENEFICEVLDPATLAPVADGQPGELVRHQSRPRRPARSIRYRTGDIVVRRSEPCACGRTLARLEGGIIARTDDMVNIRGVNVYPAAIESVVRGFDEVVEFRSTVSQAGRHAIAVARDRADAIGRCDPPADHHAADAAICATRSA